MFKAAQLILAASAWTLLLGCTDDLNVVDYLHTAKASSQTSQTRLLPLPEADDYAAQFELAQSYLEQNQPKPAMQWFSTCADAGYKPCVKELGYAYLQGYGVEANPHVGLQMLESTADKSDPAMLNDLAWFLATSKSASLRNPEKAKELVELIKQDHEMDAMTADTFAAVEASLGNFTKAAKIQQQAVNMLIRDGRIANNLLHNYRYRLKLYRAGLPYQE